MLAEEIIIAPVVTEKSNDKLQEGKYTFKVNKKATKVEIAKAVEKLFEVKVLKVNTMNVNGKKKRVGYHVGKTSDWKKAIVTIDTNPEEVSYLAKGGKQVKVSKKLFSQKNIKEEDILILLDYEQKNKGYYEDGKWVKVPDKFDIWLQDYIICK